MLSRLWMCFVVEIANGQEFVLFAKARSGTGSRDFTRAPFSPQKADAEMDANPSASSIHDFCLRGMRFDREIGIVEDRLVRRKDGLCRRRDVALNGFSRASRVSGNHCIFQYGMFLQDVPALTHVFSR